MKTQWEIRMDFQNAKAQAQRLENIADNIVYNVVRRLEQAEAQIQANWKGDNAQRYLNRQRQLMEKTYQTVTELRYVAAEIRSIAQSIYETEMAALATIKNH